MLGDKERRRRRPRNIVGRLILALIVVGIVGACVVDRVDGAHNNVSVMEPLARPLPAGADVNTAPPTAPVKLVFIHHSTGQAWLDDGHGGLGIALRDNNYFVSDTNYGWGPEAIGDRTDIGHWWTWFRSPSSTACLAALYMESGQHCDYSRLATDPGGPNEIVMFKSCYPNSQLSSPDSPVPAIADNPLKGQYCGGRNFTVANAKGIYIDLLEYFGAHPEKLFVAVVAPPVTSPDTPGGRNLANWLVDHWLQDAGYTAGNVVVFDFYNVLTSKTGGGASDVGLATGNHHRVWNGAVQHTTDDGADRLAYPGAGGDSHPNAAGDQKATAEFVPLLNAAYNAWVGNSGSDITLTYTAGDHGTIRGTSPQTVAYGASGTQVTAVPDTGYHFVSWSDGALSASRTDSNMTADLSVTATFAADSSPGPRTYAPYSASVREGQRATLYYRVTDDVAASATVTIRIRTRAGALKKTLALGLKATGPEHHCHFTCRLARGVYRFTVEARDLSGNPAQIPLGSNRLTVR
jgi:hypothetical protein